MKIYNSRDVKISPNHRAGSKSQTTTCRTYNPITVSLSAKPKFHQIFHQTLKSIPQAYLIATIYWTSDNRDSEYPWPFSNSAASQLEFLFLVHNPILNDHEHFLPLKHREWLDFLGPCTYHADTCFSTLLPIDTADWHEGQVPQHN